MKEKAGSKKNTSDHANERENVLVKRRVTIRPGVAGIIKRVSKILFLSNYQKPIADAEKDSTNLKLKREEGAIPPNKPPYRLSRKGA